MFPLPSVRRSPALRIRMCLVPVACGALLSACSMVPRMPPLPFTNAKPKLTSNRAPLRTVQSADLRRFMGDWFILAATPSELRRGTVEAIQSHALRPDGVVEIYLTTRRGSFEAPQQTFKSQAQVVDKLSNAEWKIEGKGFPEPDFFIIDLDPDYQWAVIGHPSRQHGRILARNRSLPGYAYEAIMDRLAVQGYDPGQFQRLGQTSQ